MSKVVPNTAYVEILENCENLSNGWAVLSVIDEFILDHCDSKNDLIATLMEYILERYPAVQDLEEWENILDIGYFKDLNKRFDNPSLQYLYSYLEFLSERGFDCDKFRKESKSSVISKSKSDIDHSFESAFAESVLERVCYFLIAEKCIAANTPVVDFIAVFRKRKIEKKNRIVWVKKTRTKQPYHRPLFEFLDQIVLDGFKPDKAIDISQYQQLISCFMKPNSEEFIYENLKEAYKAYSQSLRKGALKTFADNLKQTISIQIN